MCNSSITAFYLKIKKDILVIYKYMLLLSRVLKPTKSDFYDDLPHALTSFLPR